MSFPSNRLDSPFLMTKMLIINSNKDVKELSFVIFLVPMNVLDNKMPN